MVLDCAVSPLNTWSDILAAFQVPWSCKDMDSMFGGFVTGWQKCWSPI